MESVRSGKGEVDRSDEVIGGVVGQGLFVRER